MPNTASAYQDTKIMENRDRLQTIHQDQMTTPLGNELAPFPSSSPTPQRLTTPPPTPQKDPPAVQSPLSFLTIDDNHFAPPVTSPTNTRTRPDSVTSYQAITLWNRIQQYRNNVHTIRHTKATPKDHESAPEYALFMGNDKEQKSRQATLQRQYTNGLQVLQKLYTSTQSDQLYPTRDDIINIWTYFYLEACKQEKRPITELSFTMQNGERLFNYLTRYKIQVDSNTISLTTVIASLITTITSKELELHEGAYRRWAKSSHLVHLATEEHWGINLLHTCLPSDKKHLLFIKAPHPHKQGSYIYFFKPEAYGTGLDRAGLEHTMDFFSALQRRFAGKKDENSTTPAWFKERTPEELKQIFANIITLMEQDTTKRAALIKEGTLYGIGSMRRFIAQKKSTVTPEQQAIITEFKSLLNHCFPYDHKHPEATADRIGREKIIIVSEKEGESVQFTLA